MLMRTMCLAWLLVGLISQSAPAEDWPQWRGAERDGVWRETGIVDTFAGPTLAHRWSVPVGPGYSGPTVAAGRVYVTDRLIDPKQVERVHCFDEQTGKTLWSHTYDCVYDGVGYEAGPRASVTVQDGRAFALGAMGDLHVFDAASGKLLWKSRLNERFAIQMPIWGIAAAPLVVGNRVILHIGGTPDACLVALDVGTGEEIWRALTDKASYSAPILVRQAGREVLAVWTGDHIAGLDPETGSVHWKYPLPPTQMVIAVATPIVDSGRLFVTSFYDGSALLQLDADSLSFTELWRRQGGDEQHTDALHSIISTPLFQGDFLSGVDSYGELRCLAAKTGDRVWEELTATPKARWSNIQMVRNGDKIWMFNEQGELLITQLSPAGFREISRAKLIEPTTHQLNRRGQGVCWAHPAVANRQVFVRNDEQCVCVSVAAE